jgi:hypothetical protein
MIFPKQTKWRKGILNTKLCEMKLQWRNEMKIRTKAPNFALAKKLMKIQTKAPNFG